MEEIASSLVLHFEDKATANHVIRNSAINAMNVLSIGPSHCNRLIGLLLSSVVGLYGAHFYICLLLKRLCDLGQDELMPGGTGKRYFLK